MKLEIPDECAPEFMELLAFLANELDDFDMDGATEAELKAHETFRSLIAEKPKANPLGLGTSVADGIALAGGRGLEPWL